MEIMIHALRFKYKVDEVPIVFIDRIYGKSKFGIGEVKVFIKTLWKFLNLSEI